MPRIVIAPCVAIVLAASVMAATNAGLRAEEAKPPGPKPPAVTESAPGMKREILQRFDVPGADYEMVTLRVRFDANFDVKRHSHPGPESAYVLEGDVTFNFEGQPPVHRSAGQSLFVPAHAIHSAKPGPNGVILLNTYAIEKGKPLVIPAEPAPAEKAN